VCEREVVAYRVYVCVCVCVYVSCLWMRPVIYIYVNVAHEHL